MTSVRLRIPIRSQIIAFTSMKPNSTIMPPAARRIDGTRGETVFVIRRPSMRA